MRISPERYRELLRRTPLLFTVLVAYMLFPTQLVTAIWDGNSFAGAISDYAAEWPHVWPRALLMASGWVVASRIEYYFASRRVPDYGERIDGYRPDPDE